VTNAREFVTFDGDIEAGSASKSPIESEDMKVGKTSVSRI
jgi:hypothetical protein